MNSFRLRSLAAIVLLVIAFGCDREEEVPAFVKNNTVKPVDFLSSSTFTTLNVEIGYVQGFEPKQSALNHLKTFLEERLNKTVVKFTTHTIPATGRVSITVDAIRENEKAQRKLVTSGNELTAYIVFFDTEYSESTSTQKVLGIAYGVSSMAVFAKTADGFARSDMPARATLETFILNHEFSHILGLVNNGVPMVAPHQDTAHGAHCSNPDCLMYWQAETNVRLGDLLGPDDVPGLDASCIADLKAHGGK